MKSLKHPFAGVKLTKLYNLLTFLVITISGNTAVNLLGKETLYIGALMVFIVLWWLNPVKLTKQDFVVFALFAFLTLGHLLSFGSIVIPASLGLLIRLSIALLAVRLISDFRRRYVTVIYFLSLVSLMFWLPTVIGIDMQSLLSALRVPTEAGGFHIGIHNFKDEYGVGVRNMGMFWEPGAFAGYLALALFFMIGSGQNKGSQKMRALVVIAALLSTQSTTGYIALAVLATFYAHDIKMVKDKMMRLVVFSVVFLALGGGAYLASTQVSFLGEKISEQIKLTFAEDGASRINRFGNLLYDLEWIAERPGLGWSANPETRLSADSEVVDLIARQGNGLSGFAVKFGLVGLVVFVGFFVKTTRRISGSWAVALFGVTVVFVLLNGEQFLNFPIFFTLMFAPRNSLKSPPLSTYPAGRESSVISGRVGWQT
jgi:hypothetical protein